MRGGERPEGEVASVGLHRVVEREFVRSVDETARVDMKERGGGLKVM